MWSRRLQQSGEGMRDAVGALSDHSGILDRYRRPLRVPPALSIASLLHPPPSLQCFYSHHCVKPVDTIVAFVVIDEVETASY